MKPQLIVAALLFAATLSGQEHETPKPKTICGDQASSEDADLIQVACVDFDRLGIPGQSGKRTQVLVHPKHGNEVQVAVYFEDLHGREMVKMRKEPINTDSLGRRVAMVQFPGIRYTRYAVTVVTK